MLARHGGRKHFLAKSWGCFEFPATVESPPTVTNNSVAGQQAEALPVAANKLAHTRRKLASDFPDHERLV